VPALPGFPEWQPADAALEQRVMAAIRAGFEHYGFQPIDTAAVQPWEVLFSGGAQYSDGGDTKPTFEVAEPPQTRTEQRLGLRYDLTVPLARFVAEHQDSLVFPLQYYQINKVWRAERPTLGHYREFYQCDIDVIGRDELDLRHDAEIACALNHAFDKVGIAGFRIRISHRRVLAALLAAHGVHDDRTRDIVLIVDEGGRQPASTTVSDLVAAGVQRDAAQATGALLDCSTLEEAGQLLSRHGAPRDGLDELAQVMAATAEMGLPADRLCLDFSITRGHDYYTGTVFETFVDGAEEWGAIGSGGRYQGLFAGVTGINCPGVGVSIGLSRLIGLLSGSPGHPYHASAALVAAEDEASVPGVAQVSRLIRDAGVPARAMYQSMPTDEAAALAGQLRLAVLVTVRAGDLAAGQARVRDVSRTEGKEKLVSLDALGTVMWQSLDHPKPASRSDIHQCHLHWCRCLPHLPPAARHYHA
jgi:histidyl-tRNA synthetase